MRGLWECLIYNQQIRSKGNNLGLQMVSQVEGTEPFIYGISQSKQCQKWAEMSWILGQPTGVWSVWKLHTNTRWSCIHEPKIAIYDKPTLNHLLHVNGWKLTFLRRRNKRRVLILTILCSIQYWKVLPTTIRYEKIKSIQTGKEEVKLSLFADDMISYIEILKIPPKKTVRTNAIKLKIQYQHLEITFLQTKTNREIKQSHLQ